MKNLVRGLLSIFLLLLAACSTPQSRIEQNRAVFDTYPPDVREKINAGQVAVGFTPEMVRLALGEPDHKFIRKSDAGDAEVWSYHDNGPRFSFGLGVASGSRHSGMAGGVGVSSGGYDPEESIRGEFRGGKVSVIDYRRRG